MGRQDKTPRHGPPSSSPTPSFRLHSPSNKRDRTPARPTAYEQFEISTFSTFSLFTGRPTGKIARPGPPPPPTAAPFEHSTPAYDYDRSPPRSSAHAHIGMPTSPKGTPPVRPARRPDAAPRALGNTTTHAHAPRHIPTAGLDTPRSLSRSRRVVRRDTEPQVAARGVRGRRYPPQGRQCRRVRAPGRVGARHDGSARRSGDGTVAATSYSPDTGCKVRGRRPVHDARHPLTPARIAPSVFHTPRPALPAPSASSAEDAPPVDQAAIDSQGGTDAVVRRERAPARPGLYVVSIAMHPRVPRLHVPARPPRSWVSPHRVRTSLIYKFPASAPPRPTSTRLCPAVPSLRAVNGAVRTVAPRQLSRHAARRVPALTIPYV
ncbi:hypothetical protein TRAPUB_13337 [Trametes pubescens]|uniref:Uncharacterized protein n=1 Tax=Trametes pubescens TaxID=154538 RepID=A0A1M2VRA7_TRAPU|nr:hypothetical protein TRAPUB_13337 [Trametes pubescens]